MGYCLIDSFGVVSIAAQLKSAGLDDGGLLKAAYTTGQNCTGLKLKELIDLGKRLQSTGEE